MSNRSHRNAGHIGMNMLRKQGLSHSSARIAATPTQEPTSHVIAVADCLEVLRRIPTGSIQLVVCDPPYNINVAAARVALIFQAAEQHERAGGRQIALDRG